MAMLKILIPLSDYRYLMEKNDELTKLKASIDSEEDTASVPKIISTTENDKEKGTDEEKKVSDEEAVAEADNVEGDRRKSNRKRKPRLRGYGKNDGDSDDSDSASDSSDSPEVSPTFHESVWLKHKPKAQTLLHVLKNHSDKITWNKEGRISFGDHVPSTLYWPKILPILLNSTRHTDIPSEITKLLELLCHLKLDRVYVRNEQLTSHFRWFYLEY